MDGCSKEDGAKGYILVSKDLGIDFGNIRAVDKLNINVGKNEIFGLIGPNGAGKTTAFNLLTKVYFPTRGELYLNGENVGSLNSIQINKAGIARTFQNIRLFKDMTVLENVMIGFHNCMNYNFLDALFRFKKYWRVEREKEEEAYSLLCIFNLEKYAN